MATLYNIGDKIRLQGTLEDSAGTDLDPTTVTVKVLTPTGTTTTYTYAGATVTRSATGVYYVDFTPSESGTHHYQFRSTGTGQASDESVFSVAPSRF